MPVFPVGAQLWALSVPERGYGGFVWLGLRGLCRNGQFDKMRIPAEQDDLWKLMEDINLGATAKGRGRAIFSSFRPRLDLCEKPVSNWRSSFRVCASMNGRALARSTTSPLYRLSLAEASTNVGSPCRVSFVFPCKVNPRSSPSWRRTPLTAAVASRRISWGEFPVPLTTKIFQCFVVLFPR